MTLKTFVYLEKTIHTEKFRGPYLLTFVDLKDQYNISCHHTVLIISVGLFGNAKQFNLQNINLLCVHI